MLVAKMSQYFGPVDLSFVNTDLSQFWSKVKLFFPWAWSIFANTALGLYFVHSVEHFNDNNNHLDFCLFIHTDSPVSKYAIGPN